MLSLEIRKVEDKAVQEALQKTTEVFNSEPLVNSGFKHFEITVGTAVVDFQYPHNLGFVPLDVIETSLVGGAIIWKYEQFTSTHIVFSTDDAMTVRAFIGRN